MQRLNRLSAACRRPCRKPRLTVPGSGEPADAGRLIKRLLLLAFVAATVPTPPASAAGSDPSVFSNGEVSLRLVRASEPVDGAVRAALIVDLAPGWKTYWLDPGASGVPPQIDLSKTEGFQTIRARFPAPHRFGEAETRANGYKGDVAFALELDVEPGETIGTIEASVFMGVCQDICIPVQATLATSATGPEADTAVAQAFAALPQEAGDETFTVSADAASLRVTVADPGPASGSGAPDLFVTSRDGWYFDEPTQVSTQGGISVFAVPVAEAPSGASGPPEMVDLVYTRDGAALEATAVPVAPQD
ncbi:protein-disulfide reductase DsbD domain-containing protein [Aurantimonas sp. 22II-16-19i]|uniref:protein-disulfide reductase DsbD domain-containing protein n=1 Tax=Aurantimonas sp. 22II-16-19i TaxID=1317114 RepID=UPI0009F7D759|nr:protein-disulfide reductase DsbD domain-containing protein [Aurantimonas sp. 22II-16-19i]ORE97431.1 hypothetical protein ATO4_08932 [Aurantimonas sp. 22II-16-19i]